MGKSDHLAKTKAEEVDVDRILDYFISEFVCSDSFSYFIELSNLFLLRYVSVLLTYSPIGILKTEIKIDN